MIREVVHIGASGFGESRVKQDVDDKADLE